MISEETQIAALVTDWCKIPVEHVTDGIERQMVVGQDLMICRFKFAPLLVTPAHRHPHEQMTMVIKGKVKFILGDKTRVVEAGDVLHFPSNFWHGATMLAEEVILIDVFSPIREEFIQIKN